MSLDKFYKRKNEILSSDIKIALCGKHVSGDAVHVGLYVNGPKGKKIIHFVSDNQILFEDASDSKFNVYYFIELKNFDFDKHKFSLLPMLQEIADNKLIQLNLSIESVFYIDGKFKISGTHAIHHEFEKYINCAIFVISILNSYWYKLLDTDNWPNITNSHLNLYLQSWLNHHNIDASEHTKYHSYLKEIRGKHVLSSPLTTSQPSTYLDSTKSSDELIKLISI